MAANTETFLEHLVRKAAPTVLASLLAWTAIQVSLIQVMRTDLESVKKELEVLKEARENEVFPMQRAVLLHDHIITEQASNCKEYQAKLIEQDKLINILEHDLNQLSKERGK